MNFQNIQKIQKNIKNKKLVLRSFINNNARSRSLEDPRLPDQHYNFDTACSDW